MAIFDENKMVKVSDFIGQAVGAYFRVNRVRHLIVILGK
jgi:hypothetical protein